MVKRGFRKVYIISPFYRVPVFRMNIESDLIISGFRAWNSIIRKIYALVFISFTIVIIEPRHKKTCLCHKRTTKAQISLRIREVWSHLCCSLPRWSNVSSFYTRNFKPLASYCDCAARFESHLVSNPEYRFSRDEAHIVRVQVYRNISLA